MQNTMYVGNAVKIGETGIETIEDEDHGTRTSSGQFKRGMKNANAVLQPSHQLGGIHCRITKERRIKESIHIRRIRSYNLDAGYPLSPMWDFLIKDIMHPSVLPLVSCRPMGN